tara:strand:- start:69208 stop:69978 length:771 start_codon:yes stop_codon:yes gene_type:complete
LNTYKLIIQYKGTAYQGWQIQPQGKTVQGEVNKALAKISKCEDLKTIGSGRTDSGVHALGQTVKATISLEIGNDELKRGLNSLLPDDIKILAVERANESFHPIGDSEWKEYIYLFSTNRETSLFHSDFLSIYPYQLDIERMKKACELFVGRHDFADFQCVGTEVNSTTREIFECELVEFKSDWGIFPPSEDVFSLRVKGDGFLKQMVRLMVGTLWNIGLSKTHLEELESSLAAPTGIKLGAVAPAQGLYLNKVFYP